MLYKTAVDACTLSYLSKTKLIEPISKSFQFHTSNKVLEEVVKVGKEKLYKDAYYAEEMIEMEKKFNKWSDRPLPVKESLRF